MLASACGWMGAAFGRAPAASSPSATTLINADWSTDPGILNMVGAPIEDGFYVGTWPFTTGGTWTAANAIAAGAAGGPLYSTANGIGSDGTLNQALTTGTPIVIPANADCVIYVKANLGALESGLYAIGSTTTGHTITIATGDGGSDHSVTIVFDGVGTSSASAVMTGRTATGVHLLRFTRASGSWTFACTGVASAAMTPTGTVTGSLSFDTLLAYGTSGTLSTFSDAAMYLQKLYIRHGTSSPDTDYETANGGVL